jgi:hypothetical protein
VVHQRQQAGRFAGLPGGVQQEVFLLVDEGHNRLQIPAAQGRQAVMPVGADRSFGIEKAHGGSPVDGVCRKILHRARSGRAPWGSRECIGY